MIEIRFSVFREKVVWMNFPSSVKVPDLRFLRIRYYREERQGLKRLWVYLRRSKTVDCIH